MEELHISDQEFQLFQVLVYEAAGVVLTPIKKPMLVGRLGKRLRALHLPDFSSYYQLLKRDSVEFQTAIDLITTHETSFFREKSHFELLHTLILPQMTGPSMRVWSAASSTGEEAYSIAMTLAETQHLKDWQVLGSDISLQVIRSAARGLYLLDRSHGIPPPLLQRYCRKGTGRYDGHFLIDKALRARVTFVHVNLMQAIPAALGHFDIAFLRNVIIYFDPPTKTAVIDRVIQQLVPGGWLILGHSESLLNRPAGLECVVPTVFRKK